MCRFRDNRNLSFSHSASYSSPFSLRASSRLLSNFVFCSASPRAPQQLLHSSQVVYTCSVIKKPCWHNITSRVIRAQLCVFFSYPLSQLETGNECADCEVKKHLLQICRNEPCVFIPVSSPKCQVRNELNRLSPSCRFPIMVRVHMLAQPLHTATNSIFFNNSSSTGIYD